MFLCAYYVGMDVYGEITRFYKGLKTKKRIIGESLFGRKLYAFKGGEGAPVGIAVYAVHGREFITARLALSQYLAGGLTGSVWFIPLANPDGALLSQKGVSSLPKSHKAAFLEQFGEENLSLWKANGRGVDLNVNFDADWGKGAKNVWQPASENYVGEAPFSETETQAIKRFTEEINPDYTVSYHTKGEEIYWHYFQSSHTCPRDKRLAGVLSAVTGYPLKEAKGSVGGYKDWCIQKRKIPAFTVEVGRDEFSHPLGNEAWEDIDRKNRYALQALSRAVQTGER